MYKHEKKLIASYVFLLFTVAIYLVVLFVPIIKVSEESEFFGTTSKSVAKWSLFDICTNNLEKPVDVYIDGEKIDFLSGLSTVTLEDAVIDKSKESDSSGGTFFSDVIIKILPFFVPIFSAFLLLLYVPKFIILSVTDKNKGLRYCYKHCFIPWGIIDSLIIPPACSLFVILFSIFEARSHPYGWEISTKVNYVTIIVWCLLLMAMIYPRRLLIRESNLEDMISQGDDFDDRPLFKQFFKAFKRKDETSA